MRPFLKYIVPVAAMLVLYKLMAALQISDSLDMQFYYSPAEANKYLTSLAPEKSARYFYTEIYDLFFVLSYTTLLFNLAGAVLPARIRWLALVPGLFDIAETTGVLLCLPWGPTLGITTWLGLVTALKWITATLLNLVLIAGIVRQVNRRQH